MAVKYLTGYQDLSDINMWNEDEKWYKFTYNFATQGGTYTDTYNVAILPKCVVLAAYLDIETAIVGTSSTLEFGISGATAGLIAQTAEASLGTGVLVKAAVSQLGYAVDAALLMTIGTANLSAGKCHLWIKIKER